MNDTSSPEGNPAGCEPLLRRAAPSLYRRNLFRVLGLPVGATPRDARRLQARRQMREKLGIASPAEERDGPLPLVPPPADEVVREALDRLGNSVERFLDEVFWFWPAPDSRGGDPALRALAGGNEDEARRVWAERAAGQDPGHLARHNLAVLDHLLALDRELGAGGGAGGRQEKTFALWRDGLDRWREVVEGEPFWDALRDRVRELDDALLTTGFVRRVRAALPTALLLTSAKIAYGAAERADAEHALRHVRLVRDAGFGDGAADAAVREALRPARNQIKILIDTAKARWTRAPQHGNRHARELHEQAAGPLAIVDAILLEGDPTRAGLHDMVAEAVREGMVAFGNKTNDWSECDRVLALAEQVVVGASVGKRLADDRQTVRENLENGNDWCSPGYWDLPDAVVGRLEDARARAVAGDHEGALQRLLVLDAGIGTPLRRCVAYCLSQRAWQIAREGLEEWQNRPTPKIQKFLDVLHRKGSVPVPSPDTTPWALPPCPCCGKSSYTRWVNGEYQGQRFWMCSTCSEAEDRERQEKRDRLEQAIREALAFAALAVEVDDGNPGVRDSLASLEKMASEVGARTPGTEGLRRRLATGAVRRVPHVFPQTDADRVCHFCGENPPADACGITVPVCGDVQPVAMVLQEGVQYRYGEIVVPRCRQCRDEHRELPGRIEAWHEARLAAGDDEHFPEEVRAVVDAGEAADAAEERIGPYRQAVDEVRDDLRRAEGVGTRCDRCGTEDGWDGGVCRRCDGALFRFGAAPTAWAAAAVAGALAATFALRSRWAVPAGLVDAVSAAADWGVRDAGRFADGVVYCGVPLLVGAVVTGAVRTLQGVRRSRAGRRRRAELEGRREAAVRAAAERLERAVSALAEAQRAAEGPAAVREQAQARLDAVRSEAVAAFERLHPRPGLPPGVAPESAYRSFGPLEALLGNGWGFGHEIGGGDRAPRSDPAGVGGLVDRAPRLPAERVLVSCPKCGRRQRVPAAGDGARVRCPCGRDLTVRAGGERQRRSVLDLARATGGEERVACPVCGASVKAKNLAWHFDRQHGGGAPRAGEPEAAAPPGGPGREHDFVNGTCVRCGCSEGAVEAFGWACKGD